MIRRRAVLPAVVAALALVAWLRLGTLPDGLLDDRAEPSTLVIDRSGAVLYEARSAEGARAIRMRADAIPPVLAAATLGAEDHRFYRHPGLDPLAIARAFMRNARAGRVVEGGSTITQQVAKLLLARRAGSRHGWRAKVQEALVALRLEHRLAKRDILALYLTLAPYGNQITGAERASRAYFARDPAQLTPAQTAFLAALPQRPSSFNPWRDAGKAQPRQRAILRRMQALGLLSAADASHALAERVTPLRPGDESPAPHFVENVLASFGRGRRPARIQTTLDIELQRAVRGIIETRRDDLRAHGAHHVAVVVLDNRSGEWLAWEGSGDYFDPNGGTIDGARVPRQPGSALKPFTYALAFEEGYGPASVLPDVPSHFPTAEPGVFYSPRNYDGEYRGPLLARAALAGSENVPAVALLSRLGAASLLRLLRRAGVTTLEKAGVYYGLGLTLGNAEVRLDELVTAYAALARGGVGVSPVSVKGAPREGRTEERLISNRSAYWVTDILADADAREYVFGRGGSLEFPFPVAAKTGTSQAYHDNWAIGYTREVTVGVWVGNFDRTPLRNSSGVTGAGPIFHAVMLAAMERVAPASGAAAGGDTFEIVAAPSDAERRTICLVSGLAATDSCPRQALESVAREVVLSPCSWHQKSADGVATVWPDEYRRWAHDRGLIEPAPPRLRTIAIRPRSAALEILNPPQGAIYLIDPTLRRGYQTLPLRASGTSGALRWMVDGRHVGSAAPEEAVQWPLAAGAHRIEVTDARGRRAETRIIVR